MTDALTYEWPTNYHHVITDPPYSKHTHGTGATMRGGVSGRNDFGFASLSPELLAKIADLIVGAKSWSVVFCDDRSIQTWIDAVESRGGKFIRSIPWVRWSMPQLSGDRPPQGWECVLIFWGRAKGKKSWNGPGNLTHFSDKCMRGKDKHKTQKPLSLMLKIVRYFSTANETILDPCAGRGTTAKASALLGRECIWTEIDPVESEKARYRLLNNDRADAEANALDELQSVYEAQEKERMAKVTANAAKRLPTRRA
jgi:site-specific DNA-methyltransferase (adenine-specific)